MNNRTVFTILGLVIIVLGFTGIGLLQLHKEKTDALKELEIIKQQEQAKARAAGDEYAAELEKRRAEEVGKDREIERQRTLEKEREILAEREAQRIREEERREQERLARERQRQAEQELERLAQERKRRQNALTLSFALNEFQSEPRRITLVHDGDEVKISVDRKGGASKKIYVGLVPPDSPRAENDESEIFQFQDETVEPIFQLAQYRHPPAHRYRPNRVAPPPVRRAPVVRPPPPRARPILALVSVPISDRDRFRISSDLCPKSTFKSQVNTKKGAILCVGTRGSGNSSGSYLVDVEIYRNNRWNIKPSRIP